MQQLFLSPTAVTTYLRCPLQYWWRYVARVRTRPTAQMVTGLAVHRAQERAMRALLDSGRPMPDEEVVQAALDEFDALQPTAYWAADDSTEACRSEVQRLAALYARAVAPTTRPVLVEQKVSARVGPVAVEGVIDLVDADGVVRDLKVRQRAQSDGLRVDYQRPAGGLPGPRRWTPAQTSRGDALCPTRYVPRAAVAVALCTWSAAGYPGADSAWKASASGTVRGAALSWPAARITPCATACTAETAWT